MKERKKRHMNDLLIPIMAVLCILPFAVYLAEFDCGYSKYLWHSDNSVLQDFYVYWRCRLFWLISFMALVVLIFQFVIDRESCKTGRIFTPYAVYLGISFLSTVCSGNHMAAFLGNYVSWQGFFVLAGYGVMTYYTYQMMRRESDYRSVLCAVRWMFVPMSIVGWMQVFRRDLLNYDWVQRMLMPDALYERYGGLVEDSFTGNNVFLTLYNPNYAAVFLVMFAGVFFVQAVADKNKRDRLIGVLLLLDVLLLCWFTYTRAALVALTVLLILAFFIRGRGRGKLAVCVVAAGAGLLAVLFAVDSFLFDGKYAARLIDVPKDARLESVVTTEEGIEITYAGQSCLLTFADVAEGEIRLPLPGMCFADQIEWEEEPQILVQLDDHTLQFVKRDGCYYYYTEWGKVDRMTEIPAADFCGYEYLGSGRLYIWSRVIPMLKRYLIWGSGPDTFAEVFPQNDYVGKMVYAEHAGRVMEGAHNVYLMYWVQTGLLSLIALLIFYGIILWRCCCYYRSCALDTEQTRLGFGCFLGCVGYLVCGFFSDAMLYTAPVFYIFLGIAYAACDRG